MHNSSLDPIVVPEICLSGASFRHGLFALDFQFFKFFLVADGLEKILNLGIFSLQLILMIASLFNDLFDLFTAKESFLLVPKELISHLFKDILDFICHFCFISVLINVSDTTKNEKLN